MTDQFTDVDQWTAGLELLGNESMAKVVDFSILNSSDMEVSVQVGTDISDQERIAGLGDENRGIATLGTNGQVFL